MTFLNPLSRVTMSLCAPTAFVSSETSSLPVRSDSFLYGVAGVALAATGCGGESLALGATAGLLAAVGVAAWLVRRRPADSIRRLGPKPSEIVNLNRPETWRRDQAARIWSEPERYGEAARRLKEVLLESASAGTGADPHFADFFLQKNDECQTIAIFNGALGYDSEVLTRYARDLDARIRAIREGAQARSEGGQYDITSVGLEMMTQGYPLRVDVDTGRPVAFIRSLFRRNWFAVHSGPGHATTFLPLAGATAERFALEIDSLGTRSVRKDSLAVSLEEFLNRYLGTRPGEFFNLYEWTPLSSSRTRPAIKRIE